MFICKDCGAVFEEPHKWVERHGLETPPYERFNGCPECGGDYVEAVRCECCGEHFAEDDLIYPLNFCEDCFRESITPENFAELAMESEDGTDNYEIAGILEDFMFSGIMGFHKQWFLNRSSLEFKRFMAREYSRMALSKNESGRLTEALRDYVLHGATRCADEYAEFLYERRKENG